LNLDTIEKRKTGKGLDKGEGVIIIGVEK